MQGKPPSRGGRSYPKFSQSGKPCLCKEGSALQHVDVPISWEKTGQFGFIPTLQTPLKSECCVAERFSAVGEGRSCWRPALGSGEEAQGCERGAGSRLAGGCWWQRSPSLVLAWGLCWWEGPGQEAATAWGGSSSTEELGAAGESRGWC